MNTQNKNKIIKRYMVSPCLSISELKKQGVCSLDYDSVVSCCDTVIVLGAGPSLNDNISSVNKYLKNSVVIGTSYNFSIPSDYLMVVGKSTYNRVTRAKCKNFIITEWVYFWNHKHIKLQASKMRKNYFMIRTSNKNTSGKYWEGGISVNSDGSFNHWLSNCGFTAMLAASYFKPKRVVILGFDGPEDDGVTLHHFNGITRKQKGAHATKEVSIGKGRFLGKIIKFLNSLGIEVIASKYDRLWSLECVFDISSLNFKRGF